MRHACAVVTLVLCGLFAGRVGEAGQTAAAPPAPAGRPSRTGPDDTMVPTTSSVLAPLLAMVVACPMFYTSENESLHHG